MIRGKGERKRKRKSKRKREQQTNKYFYPYKYKILLRAKTEEREKSSLALSLSADAAASFGVCSQYFISHFPFPISPLPPNSQTRSAETTDHRPPIVGIFKCLSHEFILLDFDLKVFRLHNLGIFITFQPLFDAPGQTLLDSSYKLTFFCRPESPNSQTAKQATPQSCCGVNCSIIGKFVSPGPSRVSVSVSQHVRKFSRQSFALS